MSSWTLAGRKNDPLMRYKAILQQSFAFSRTFNSRNVEFYWYPLWDQTLSDLVADIPNLIVAPQYPAWFVPEDDQEDEGNDDHDADDPEEVDIPGSDDYDDGLQESEGEELDVSFALTIPEKKAKSVLVDFAVINVSGIPHTQQKSRYGGWRITEAKVGLLVELKRFARRGLIGDDFDGELNERVGEAREDLVVQAAHVFIQDERLNDVLAIAAAGPYWSNTKISRADVKDVMLRLKANDPTYQATGLRLDPKLKWSNPLHLNIARSNNRLHTIYKSLKGMGVLEIPQGV